MNIFLLDYNKQKCAEYMVNSHVVKMITEHCQMLSTVVRLSGIDAGYKITHAHHPCTKWTGKSLSNWLFLRELTGYIHYEWQYRYDHPSTRIHKAYEILLSLPMPRIPDLGITAFPMAIPDALKSECVVESYRKFYNTEKRHLFKWSKRNQPYWIEGELS